jgi:hypothetical protein
VVGAILSARNLAENQLNKYLRCGDFPTTKTAAKPEVCHWLFSTNNLGKTLSAVTQFSFVCM